MSTPDNEDFFVGYLPMPTRLKRFVWLAAAAMLLGCLAFASLTAALRDAPASSTLRPNVTLVGLVEARAYGILWTLDADGEAYPVMLARGGKLGAPETVTKLAGGFAQLSGLLLERDGYRLLEVAKVEPAPTLVEPAHQASAACAGRRRRADAAGRDRRPQMLARTYEARGWPHPPCVRAVLHRRWYPSCAGEPRPGGHRPALRADVARWWTRQRGRAALRRRGGRATRAARVRRRPVTPAHRPVTHPSAVTSNKALRPCPTRRRRPRAAGSPRWQSHRAAITA